MNKKILNLLIISSCAMFSVAANYDKLSPFGLQNNTTNTQKPLPTEQSIGPSITPGTTPLMPSTTPEIGTTLKAPEFSKQKIQKTHGFLNGQPVPSGATTMLAALGIICWGIVIAEAGKYDPQDNVTLPMTISLSLITLSCWSYEVDKEAAKNRQKDLIEKTNEI